MRLPSLAGENGQVPRVCSQPREFTHGTPGWYGAYFATLGVGVQVGEDRLLSLFSGGACGGWQKGQVNLGNHAPW
ncbi:MAG: hypothetical protein L0H29_11080, partial [Sinobacteraceae bacterium]|nr:hypothetical protein [Nevskiaceae bacterium]